MSETKSTNYFKQVWNHFKEKHPALVEFLMFFLISNGVTVLQMILMPFIKFLFGFTHRFRHLQRDTTWMEASIMFLIMQQVQLVTVAVAVWLIFLR